MKHESKYRTSLVPVATVPAVVGHACWARSGSPYRLLVIFLHLFLFVGDLFVDDLYGRGTRGVCGGIRVGTFWSSRCCQTGIGRRWNSDDLCLDDGHGLGFKDFGNDDGRKFLRSLLILILERESAQRSERYHGGVGGDSHEASVMHPRNQPHLQDCKDT